MTPQQQRILQKIELDPALAGILKNEKTLPAPYHPSGQVKAIVLGADPSNPNGDTFTYVFGIDDGDKRYFQGIENNLKQVGLSRNEVFVQNVVQNYCTQVTGNNKVWDRLAKLWLPELKRELDLLPKNLPVFITAGKILFALSDNYAGKDFKFSQFYDEPAFVPANNILERKIFPLFRHPAYSLANPKWSKYKQLILLELKQVTNDSI